MRFSRLVSWRDPGLVIVTLCAAGLIWTVATSCSLIRFLSPSPAPQPRPFNHEAHIVRGVSCADCHEGAEKEVKAGMPTKAFCMNCHEDLDKEKDKPLEKKVAWFLGPDGEPRWAWYGRQKDEVNFSHASHFQAKVACTSCHGGMDKDTGLIPRAPQRMSSCVACHETQAPAKRECSTCHTSIDRTRKPENHDQLWSKSHGACARAGAETATLNNCSLCHQQNSCTTCHQTALPEDHNNFWRLKAHGIASSLDRSRCTTCHRTDYCTSCHQVTAPLSHGPGWNAPRSDHCQSCHVPVQTSPGCAVCHKDSGGHPTSPPKPAWHTPGMNCVACHGPTLKHFNPGGNCNACHR
jgi:hypothetical protein